MRIEKITEDKGKEKVTKHEIQENRREIYRTEQRKIPVQRMGTERETEQNRRRKENRKEGEQNIRVK